MVNTSSFSLIDCFLKAYLRNIDIVTYSMFSMKFFMPLSFVLHYLIQVKLVFYYDMR